MTASNPIISFAEKGKILFTTIPSYAESVRQHAEAINVDVDIILFSGEKKNAE